MSRQPKICLAASGGGHVRQLLDLKPFWTGYDHFFVTEDTALGRSIAVSETVEFVPHFALGQAWLGSPWRMLGAAAANAWKSFRIVRKLRPDFVVTTGAGSQIFILMWARIHGAKIVLIDSFARFDAPSTFARLAGPLAHLRISQSPMAAKKWGTATVFNPLKMLRGPGPQKEALLFATVGATLPFPRLSRLVADAKRVGIIEEEVVLQVGAGCVTDAPQGVLMVEDLAFEEVKALLVRASIVICHGGTGSIVTALQNFCHVIVVPRRFEFGEHYDNHQEEITSAFAKRGLVRIADDEASLANALADLRNQPRVGASTDPAELIRFLGSWIG
jgi:UDP-N-acetylglucosamine--N-acetylmuramyl-(pentapeptide) pyrophosphoryl-undecaprenol N-acetylglucosamine transferase